MVEVRLEVPLIRVGDDVQGEVLLAKLLPWGIVGFSSRETNAPDSPMSAKCRFCRDSL
jgi:hypothetical protein